MGGSRFYQMIKNAIHAIQAILILVTGAITVGILTKDGPSDGQITFYLVVCLICIPGLIYQAVFPMFKFTQRFSHAYAHAVIDSLLTILWLGAFLGDLVWVKDGSQAAKDWKKGDKECDVFGWGSTSRCTLGQVNIGFGAAICILFALTTAFSIYGISFFRRHGHLPGREKSSKSEVEAAITAADRGDNALPPHPQPNTLSPINPEMREADRPFQLHEIQSAASNSPEGRANLPERPVSWQLPSHPEYVRNQPHTEAHIVNPFSPSHSDEYQSSNPYYTNYASRTPPPQYFHGPPTTADDYEEPPSPTFPEGVHHDPYDSQYRPSAAQDVPRIRVDTSFANQHYRNQGRYDLGPRAEFPAGEYGR